MQKGSISAYIYESLKKEILTGHFQAGERLPSEQKLSLQYKASRVSVRSALLQLRGLGLVETRRGGGTFVLEQSNQNALSSVLTYVALSQFDRMNIYEFRSIQEIQSAGIAALRATSQDVDDMRKAIKNMISSEIPSEMARYDLDFHEAIAKATHNEYIFRVFDVMRDVYYNYLRQNTESIGSYGAKSHEAICNAIEMRNSEKARQLMQKHLEETRELLFDSTILK